VLVVVRLVDAEEVVVAVETVVMTVVYWPPLKMTVTVNPVPVQDSTKIEKP